MTKLTVGKLVDTTVGTNTEVSPNIARRLELDALDGTGSRLETFIGVLGGDTGGNNVRVNRHVVFRP